MPNDLEPIWSRLEALRPSGDQRITSLFDNDPDRAEDFRVVVDGLIFDYSKTSIDAEARAALLELAAGVPSRRDAMFSGRRINETEDRAVLHTALRNFDTPLTIDGEDVSAEVSGTLDRMSEFAKAVRDGSFTGQGGRITDIVNIGIGGSDLGPAMAALALSPYHDGPRTHFVSNVDSADIADTLTGLNPETTLIIVASKTFTTIETMTNAQTALNWMKDKVSEPSAQFAALSSSAERTTEWGIDASRVFGFADWVGGRYSMWGPIGVSLMIAIGPDNFREFLRGGAAMDAHFRDAPLERNMPVLLGLVGIWHYQINNYPTRAVLPYDNRLMRLPAYLQQLEMESNGKRVAMDGSELTRNSGPVVWGEPGTNGQHAFYQLIHQGTQIVPCEFIAAARGHEPDLDHHHKLLLANCLAQSEALMCGRDLDTARELMTAKGLSGDELERQARHRVFPGNRPSTTLLMEQLTPFTLGQIVALYEHRVFVEGTIFGINSFDQWGVELGKELALKVAPLLDGKPSPDHDPSTQALADQILKMRAGTR
ncbi:glucose-6-phosphate isomerase [Paracoccus aerodenitrificans]|uniref:glucose-6-phosphate isomerase n=1 Tax=Paracoccus aerodenitrificans TaxID=3017781 RepID=UPI0022F099BF|nr:glucose-6-phosphate isomerase [Paracoccus aerodenitrificans]WBU65059.1 glucose-6-phosphate isomerase [Paracoccus aerodenitrificans]